MKLDPTSIFSPNHAQCISSDPVVEEICLLTDGLSTAIAEYDALRQRADPEGASDRVAA